MTQPDSTDLSDKTVKEDHSTALPRRIPPRREKPGRPLLDWEVQLIEIFVRASDLLGIPKSVGQTYGLLFASEKPLPMETIMTRLQISKGSTSQALATLRRLKAVVPVFIPGDRRDHYAPELEIKKIITGFLKEQVEPHLESGESRLNALDDQKQEVPKEIQKRIKRLGAWRGRAEKLLPLITTVLGGSK